MTTSGFCPRRKSRDIGSHRLLHGFCQVHAAWPCEGHPSWPTHAGGIIPCYLFCYLLFPIPYSLSFCYRDVDCEWGVAVGWAVC